ncbi:DUF6478 family protein [Ruegeria sp. 2205SS24-7]|uniref:DUF6478 family protein n=1 Tax=Ruegeria discodermiae TaxID=3064389 RepID=UPI0027406056|nr:DUF6478 family protein [Ruegeria sp. 2205SS24-7]MDP5219983.1 DUF6478 family protein [Ruegeria sp. 2205SS24-7]
MSRVLDRLFHNRTLRRWELAAQQAGDLDLPTLRQQRNQARALRKHLDQVIHTADGRLARPEIGSSFFSKPHGTDWSWRPELWRGPLPVSGIASARNRSSLGGEVTLFHDCSQSELTLRQCRNLREEDLAPFGLRMDVLRFEGSFLSLVVDFPPEATVGLSRGHLIRVDTTIASEKPIEIFARLNIRHGPNTEQITRELPLGDEEVMVEFDLAYSRLNEKRIEKIWLDLIFEAPDFNQVVIRDLTLCRVRRAAL